MFFAFVGWPWSNQQSKLIKARFQQRDEVSLLAPGQFRESPTSHRVFFIEKMSPDQAHVQNVFVTSTEGGKVNVVVSKNGHTETHANGDRFVVLENGRRYDGEPGQPEFPHHGVRALRREDPEPAVRQHAHHHRHVHARRCCANPTNDNLAEFAWRAGLPLIAINLMLLAIPLVLPESAAQPHHQSRDGRADLSDVFESVERGAVVDRAGQDVVRGRDWWACTCSSRRSSRSSSGCACATGRSSRCRCSRRSKGA